MSSLSEVRWIDLPTVHDNRGSLTFIESEKNIPFEIRRIFYIHHVIGDRGGHAHTDTEQIIVALSGSFTLELSDGSGYVSYRMSDPEKGLYIPKMIFANLLNFSTDSVCLVLASTHFIDDYIHIEEMTPGRDK